MDADEAVSKSQKNKEKTLPFKKQEFVKGSKGDDKKSKKKAASSSSSDVSIKYLKLNCII
jgi:hypothetical protein